MERKEVKVKSFKEEIVKTYVRVEANEKGIDTDAEIVFVGKSGKEYTQKAMVTGNDVSVWLAIEEYDPDASK